MGDYRLTVQIEGPKDEGGHMRLSDFVTQLEYYQKSLRHTDTQMHGASTVDFRVINLSHSSPLTVELEVIQARNTDADCRLEVLEGFSQAFEAVSEQKPLPEWVDTRLLEHLLAIAKPVGTKISRSDVTIGGQKVFRLDRRFKQRVQLLLMPADTCEGSVVGKMDIADFHTGDNVFIIFPIVGPARVKCVVPPSLKEKAIASLERRVEVRGTLTFNQASRFPASVEVKEIEILDTDPSISIFDLRGIAPDCTGELSSEEFVRNLRSEWA